MGNSGMDEAAIKAAQGVDVAGLQSVNEAFNEAMAGYDFDKVTKNILPILKVSQGIDLERVKALKNVDIYGMKWMVKNGVPELWDRLDLNSETLEECHNYLVRTDGNMKWLSRAIRQWNLHLITQDGNVSKKTMEYIQAIGPHRLVWYEKQLANRR